MHVSCEEDIKALNDMEDIDESSDVSAKVWEKAGMHNACVVS